MQIEPFRLVRRGQRIGIGVARQLESLLETVVEPKLPDVYARAVSANGHSVIGDLDVEIIGAETGDSEMDDVFAGGLRHKRIWRKGRSATVHGQRSHGTPPFGSILARKAPTGIGGPADSHYGFLLTQRAARVTRLRRNRSRS
jgi:hypothetical protein